MKKPQRTTTQACSASLTLLAFAAALTLLAAPAHAAVLAEYLFTTNMTSSDTELNSIASDFTITASAGFGRSGAESNAFAATHTAVPGGLTHGSVANAVAYDNFFSFTVTPDSGQMFNLTTLTFDSIHNNTANNTGGAAVAGNLMNFFVRSSVDNFAANVGSTFSQAHNATLTLIGRTVDLTGVDFQGVDEAVTFRFYAYTDQDLRNNQGARWDNVRLNGEVVLIPEPSTALLGGLGALLILLRRRR